MNELLSPGHSETKLHVTAPWFLPGIIGGALIVSAAIIGWSWFAVHSLDNVIVVTGSAKQHVVSDSVKWRLSISRKVNENTMASGYPLLANDLKNVQAFLKANSIPDSAVTASQVFVDQVYNYNGNYAGPQEYNLHQDITIQSSDVHGIDALSKDLSVLANKNVFVSGNYLEFYVSTLPDLRVSLLADAVKDAKARAGELAKAGGQNVGPLKSASSGVVQVLSPNSVDISDYGQYDTQSIEKDVMVTARATFFVR